MHHVYRIDCIHHRRLQARYDWTRGGYTLSEFLCPAGCNKKRNIVPAGRNTTDYCSDGSHGQLIRQESDLGKTASSTAGVGAAASGSSSGTQSTESSAPLSSKHRLSKGAIVGITVGTLIGTLAILGAIVYLFRARRQLAQSGTVTVSVTTTPALEQTADWSTGMQVASSGKRDTYFSEKTQEPAMKVAQGEATGGESSVGLGDGPYEMPAVQPAPLHELPG